MKHRLVLDYIYLMSSTIPPKSALNFLTSISVKFTYVHCIIYIILYIQNKKTTEIVPVCVNT